MSTVKILGADLKVGDTIIPWYEKTAVIDGLFPYVSPLAYLFKQGARTASFAAHSEFASRGMTIDNGAYYTKVVKE